MSFLTETDIVRLQLHANGIRRAIVDMLCAAGSGHTAGSLGMADIFTAFYFQILNHNPQDPNFPDRDRLILSNGHIAPVRYAAMANSGYFPVEELASLRKLESRLQGHPERTHLPGVETTSGPLGEGLSQAIGMALAGRMDEKDFYTYCLMSDGEQQCGIVWEAAMLAGKEKLSHLIAVLDRNNIQISGTTEQIMPLEPLCEKYESFGWHVLEVDGNNIEMFCDAVEQAKAETEKPTLIVAHTIPGSGVRAIENDHRWHGRVPNEKEAKEWTEELLAAREKIGTE